MGAGRKTRTVEIDTSTPMVDCPSIPFSFREQQRNLGDKLAGAIFGCTSETIDECINDLVFGLPFKHITYVEGILAGMPLFLFNYTGRLLHGVFVALSDGQLDIKPYGWTGGNTVRTAYPAQVRVKVFKRCPPIREVQFKEVLKQNYRDNVHFTFELDRAQVRELCKLFKCDVPPGTGRLSAAPKPRNRDQGGPSSISEMCDTREVVKPVGKKAWAATTTQKPVEYANGGDVASTEAFPPLGAVRTTGKGKGHVKKSKSKKQPPGSNIIRPGKQVRTPSNSMESPTSVAKKSTTKTNSMHKTGNDEMRTETDFPKLATGPSVGSEGLRSKGARSVKDISVLCLEGSDDAVTAKSTKVTVEKQLGRTCQTATIVIDDAQLKDSGGTDAGKPWIKTGDKPVDEVKDVEAAGHVETNGGEVSKTGRTPNAAEEEGNGMQADHKIQDDGTDPPTISEQGAHSSELSQGTGSPQISGAKRILGILGIGRNSPEPVDNGIGRKTEKEHLPIGTAQHSEASGESYNPLSMKNSQYGSSKELLYLIGGLDGKSKSKFVEVFDDTTGLWVKGPELPVGKFMFGAAAAIHEQVFIFGGGQTKEVGNGAWCLDTNLGKWKKLASLLQARASFGAQAIEEKIYILGGGVPPSKELSSMEIYDPLIDMWSEGPNMNIKRFAPGVAGKDGIIFVAGGYDGKKYLKSAEMLDPRQGKWMYLPDMSIKRGSLACAMRHGSLWAIGGWNAIAMIDSVEVYETRKGAWQSLAPLSVARGYCTTELVNDTIYVIGGRKNKETIDLTPMQKYNSRSAKWDDVLPAGISGVRAYHSTCVLRRHV